MMIQITVSLCGQLELKISLLECWVSLAQRGFLLGCSMLATVIDIEHAPMLSPLKQDRSALILFDFAAVFPSVSHAFIVGALRHADGTASDCDLR